MSVGQERIDTSNQRLFIKTTKNHPIILRFIPDHLETTEIVFLKNPVTLKFIPDHLKRCVKKLLI